MLFYITVYSTILHYILSYYIVLYYIMILLIKIPPANSQLLHSPIEKMFHYWNTYPVASDYEIDYKATVLVNNWTIISFFSFLGFWLVNDV